MTVQVAGQAGFLLIINGFVKFTADNASGIPMTTSAPVSEIDAEVSDFKPLTAEEAQRLREKNPEMSPWWVIGAQVAMGILVAGVAWMWTQRPGAAVSAFYGAMAVAIPAALFVRGVRRAGHLCGRLGKRDLGRGQRRHAAGARIAIAVDATAALLS